MEIVLEITYVKLLEINITYSRSIVLE